MILTCPECATSYFVDDSRVPPTGRRVRCSSCGHRWLAGPDGPIAEAPTPEPLAPEPISPEYEAAPEDDLEAVPVAPIVAPLGRPRRNARPRRADTRSGALVWAGAAALAAALIAGVIVFREQVVGLWPASSAAYAGLGLAVDGGGLVFEHVHAQPAFLAGRPVLSVSGAIRNIRDAPVNAPPVRLTLLDRAGKPVAAKIARPMDAEIPARATRHFIVTLLDPPATARDLEVRFDTPGGKSKAVQAVGPAPGPAEAAAEAPPASAPPAAAAPAEAAPTRLSPAEATEHG